MSEPTEPPDVGHAPPERAARDLIVVIVIGMIAATSLIVTDRFIADLHTSVYGLLDEYEPHQLEDRKSVV